MLLTLTWCHCTPTDTPASRTIIVISDEHQIDYVASAGYISWLDGAATFLHQGCSVPVGYCQVAVGTGGMISNVKCSELQRKDQSLLHLYRLGFLEVLGIVARVVW